jgi:hypothetical protein
VIDGATLSTGFLTSPSSLAAADGPAKERLDDPEVDTVESEDDEGCEGWPRRVWLAGVGSCCWTTWGEGAVGLFSWRNWGVLLKA